MSIITKEKALAISDLKAGYTLGHNDVAILNELARIALASLEAEAVAYIIQDADARSRGEKGMLRYFANISDEDINEYQITVTPLFTAPQAPVSVPTFDEWLEIRGNKPLGWVKDAMRESYDACRAAMLQGADGNSPVIPDGWKLVPVELTQDMRAAWDLAPNTDDDDYNMQAAYRSMIAAAPQQEVKP